ncbi:MAG: hypothetical protein ORN57_01925 [Alphaproteobacteria bacterium]|nr:hypothetical protein [Alphaproteobacteria bacterium]
MGRLLDKLLNKLLDRLLLSQDSNPTVVQAGQTQAGVVVMGVVDDHKKMIDNIRHPLYSFEPFHCYA